MQIISMEYVMIMKKNIFIEVRGKYNRYQTAILWFHMVSDTYSSYCHGKKDTCNLSPWLSSAFALFHVKIILSSFTKLLAPVWTHWIIHRIRHSTTMTYVLLATNIDRISKLFILSNNLKSTPVMAERFVGSHLKVTWPCPFVVITCRRTLRAGGSSTCVDLKTRRMMLCAFSSFSFAINQGTDSGSRCSLHHVPERSTQRFSLTPPPAHRTRVKRLSDFCCSLSIRISFHYS